ncbi:MAG: ion transporter [Acidobacteria bacterium]|nr:ion transporter [Acidobacteriota bacterium]MCA1637928.1 ion transporter [Acidobacteriota bacterium]
MNEEKNVVREKIKNERVGILRQLEDWLETPMLILSFVWLALFIYEVIYNLSPLLETVAKVIWIIFIVDFVLKLILAPDKTDYLKNNWLTAIALLLPALRVFRIFRVFRILRVARAARGLRLVRLLTSLNRGMRALGASFSRRGFGYVLVLTLIVLFVGAAGMYGFENEVEGGFKNYAGALWWTAMMLTTIGSDYFPQTAEGRILCFILALYAFAVFGYITATLATFFVERDTEKLKSEETPTLAELQMEIKELRSEIRQLLTERQAQS